MVAPIKVKTKLQSLIKRGEIQHPVLYLLLVALVVLAAVPLSNIAASAQPKPETSVTPEISPDQAPKEDKDTSSLPGDAEADPSAEATGNAQPSVEAAESLDRATLASRLKEFLQPRAPGYIVTGDTTGANYGTFPTFNNAVGACRTTEPCTITATGDETMGAQVDIPKNKSITLTSDSGGPYTILQPNQNTDRFNSRHIRVLGTLTLKSITLSGLGLGSGTSYNGGVYVYSAGALNIEDGATITKCYNINGGGVESSLATLIINGGSVSNNRARTHGGGVYTSNSGSNITEINSGEINGNRAASGEGGGLFISSACTVAMSGGAIKDNITSTRGGGVTMQLSTAKFFMTGGEISGNICTSGGVANGGGGIFTPDTSFSNPTFMPGEPGISGQEVYKNIGISGTAAVFGNTTGQPYSPPVDKDFYTTRTANPFSGDLLDHNNINYEPRNFVVTYKVNDGSGRADYHQIVNYPSLRPDLAAANAVVHGAGGAGFTPLPGKKFTVWSESATGVNGSIVTYAENDPLSAIYNKVLYARWRDVTNVEVSKTVAGENADQNKDFTFTMQFLGVTFNPLPSGTNFTYTGDKSGTFTLDASGMATFTLRHGQSITVEEIPSEYRVVITETVDSNYSTAFKDSRDAGSTTSNTTGQRGLGEVTRTFDFINTRNAVVPAGISAGSSTPGIAVIPFAIIAIAGVLFICRKQIVREG